MAPAAKHLLLLSTVLLAQQAIAQFDYNTTLLGTVTTFISVSTIPGEWLQAASIVPAVRWANIKTCIASACSADVTHAISAPASTCSATHVELCLHGR